MLIKCGFKFNHSVRNALNLTRKWETGNWETCTETVESELIYVGALILLSLNSDFLRYGRASLFF